MKKLLKFIFLGGLVAWLVTYLKGDTAAGEWHNLPDTDPGL